MKKILLLFILFSISITSFSQEFDLNEDTTTETHAISALSATPNPMIEKTTITFLSKKKGNVELVIKGLIGGLVFKSTIQATKGKNQVDFYKNSLPKGTYIFFINNSGHLNRQRLVIE